MRWVELHRYAPGHDKSRRNAALTHAELYLKELSQRLEHPDRLQMVGYTGWGELSLIRRILKEIQVAALYHIGDLDPALRCNNSPIVLNRRLPSEFAFRNLDWLHSAHGEIGYPLPRAGRTLTAFQEHCANIADVIVEPGDFEVAGRPTRWQLIEKTDKDFLFPALNALGLILERGFPVG